jgi:hypothetical protein
MWTGPESAAWTAVRGSQEDVGKAVAAILDERDTTRIEDFGGVCETFLCEGATYREAPPRVRRGGSVFSFTPKNRLVLEGQEMARVAHAAGYDLLVLTLQKHDRFGKVWVLDGILRYLEADGLAYYEDTNTVVDELKSSPAGHRVHAIHVLSPGYEEHVSRLADRVVTQRQYQHEVLEAPEGCN